jgi:hypothetical protein
MLHVEESIIYHVAIIVGIDDCVHADTSDFSVRNLCYGMSPY